MKLKTARPVAKLRQGRTDWYRIANKAGDGDQPADVYIYDEIGYWGTTAQQFVDDLREITADQINLHLNSPGGDVFDGFAIYQALLDHPAQVTSRVDALAASAASIIAMAGQRIVMGRTAMMMIHDAWGLAIGNAADMRDMANRLDKISNTIAGVYAERAGGPVEFWRQAMLEESWYNADEAVQAGLADEVARRATGDQGDEGDGGEGGQGQAPKDSWDLSIYRYAGRQHAPAPPLRPHAHPASAPGAAVAAVQPPPATPGSAPTAPQPAPALDDPFAELPDEAFTSLADPLEDVFDPMGGYDPQAVSSAIGGVYEDAPAPPQLPPRPDPPATSISIDEMIGAIQEGVRP